VLCDLSGGGAERLVLGLCAAGLVHQEVATVQPGGTLRGAFEAAGVRVHEGRRRPGRPGLGSLVALAGVCRSFDLVHTHLFAGDTWGRLAARLAGRPSVSTEHNVNRDERARHRAVKRALAPLSSRVVYVSEACRSYALEVEGVAHPGAVVISNGIDLGRFAVSARASAQRPSVGPGTRLLAIGRDVPQKGFDVLLRSLPPGFSLRIAGRSQRRGIERLGGSTVEWLGERDDVPELLAEADILVVPSRWEGFGLVAVEAMAAGVPVVASGVDGLLEVLGDVGVFVPPEDPQALRAALQRLSEAPEERAQRALRGRHRSAMYALDVCAERYRTLYQQVLAVKPA